MARACGASELWGLRGAVKQRAPGVANVVEGKQEARSGEEGGGWQVEGRGEGPGTPPRRCPHGGACLRARLRRCCSPIGCQWAVGSQVWGPRRPRLGVHCGGRDPPKEEREEQKETEWLERTNEQGSFWKPRAGSSHPGAAVSLANAMMPPGAQAGRHHRGCLCGPGDGQEQLGVVPRRVETRGCRPSGRVAASLGGAVAKAGPWESSAGRWPQVSGVEGDAGQRLRPGAGFPGWAGQLEAAPCPMPD